MKTCVKLSTFGRSIGTLEELLVYDIGININHPDFEDVYLPNEASNPAKFDVTISLSDQINMHNEKGGLIHGGYAFHEDYHASNNELLDAPIVVPAHQVKAEDIVLGKSYSIDQF
ncbi:hypothetical protein POM88_000701 [Heracleum sosnowskyi]|uniref:Uncharacterized protein n=1 Tax=Heracleum sosnowskyi TaxID=360622 RepID=A0AAD8JEF3_9APIA|nr:hypothetical protein POM88_000701 [Heracleum sosnowskyi]